MADAGCELIKKAYPSLDEEVVSYIGSECMAMGDVAVTLLIQFILYALIPIVGLFKCLIYYARVHDMWRHTDS